MRRAATLSQLLLYLAVQALGREDVNYDAERDRFRLLLLSMDWIVRSTPYPLTTQTKY
jgi:hypothetical protein